MLKNRIVSIISYYFWSAYPSWFTYSYSNILVVLHTASVFIKNSALQDGASDIHDTVDFFSSAVDSLDF